VQDEERFALAGTENGFVEVRVLPSGELFWLVQGQTGFHGKSVFGRLRVFFNSSGSAISERARIPFVRTVVFPVIIFPVNRAGNIGKRCNYVCYNNEQVVSAVEGVQPFPCAQNRNGGTPSRPLCV